MHEAVKQNARTEYREETWKQLLQGIRFVSGTFDDPDAFRRLRETVEKLDVERGTMGNHAYYLSIPPKDFAVVAEQLRSSGLVDDTADQPDRWRRVVIDAIRNDPEWRGGHYTSQPQSLRTAQQMLFLMGSNPVVRQHAMTTLAQSDEVLDAAVRTAMQSTDANDVLYQVEASRDYDPSPGLDHLRAAVLAINSADDERNPPELRNTEAVVARLANARHLLLPADAAGAGHGTVRQVRRWKEACREFLAALA